MRTMLIALLASVLACGGGQPAAQPAPTATQEATPPPARPDEDCTFLRDRLTTALVRLDAIAQQNDDAAKFHALADVFDKLARDMDHPFKNESVGALAGDYREAAKATA